MVAYDHEWWDKAQDYFDEFLPQGLTGDMMMEDFQSFTEMLRAIDYGIDVRDTLGWAELEERWGAQNLESIWDWEDFREWYESTH